MQRFVLSDQLDDIHDKIVALKIRQIAELSVTLQVIRFVCITTRTSERTFPRNLDRHRRIAAAQYPAPGLKNIEFIQSDFLNSKKRNLISEFEEVGRKRP